MINAVIAIRNDKTAPAFRYYVWECRRAFDPIYATDHVKAAHYQKKLEALGQRIARGGSADGVNFTIKTLSLSSSNVPQVGHILHALGLSFKVEKKTKIPRIPPPPNYELFMANWFA